MAFINWGSESPEQLKARRAMEEQMMFEQAAFNAATAAAAAGVGSGGRRPGSFQFVVDTTNELEFRLEFTSTNEPIEFTINWGDGNIHEDSGAGGFYEEFHTYEEAGQYTVTVTFNKPQNVLALDFDGFDGDYASLVSITNLQNLTNLEGFRADYNSLVSVDLSGMNTLTWVDISDCDEIGSGDPSLTGVNLAGCTGLLELRLDDSDFSAGLPTLRGLDNLQNLDVDDSGLSGLIDLSYLPSLERCDLSSNDGITAVTISRSQPIGANESRLDLDGCSLTQAAVDFVLVELSLNSIADGYVDITGPGNAIPSATGLAAKTVLEGRGWNVDVNMPLTYVSIPASTDFDIGGGGDFTIEMFVKFNNIDFINFNDSPRPYSFGAYPTAANAISFQGPGTINFFANSSGSPRSFGSFVPTIGQWYHVCAMRSSDNIYLFIDGINVGSYLYADPILSQSLPLTIGYGNEANSSLNGLISNFRWTSSAVYDTTSFSVPNAPLTDLPATKLLIFQGTDLSTILTDNSGNGHNATGTGIFAYSSEDPFNSAQGSLQVG
jgi:hypothetical protein